MNKSAGMAKYLLLINLIFIMLMDASEGAWVNSKVGRSIDLKTHIVKITTSVTMRNDGSSSESEIAVHVEPDLFDKLAFLEVNLVDGENNPLSLGKKGKGIYSVTLPKACVAGDSVSLSIEEYFTHSLKAFPEEISQSQKQLVTYNGNHLFYSPYMTESQTTTVELFSNVVENHSKLGKTEIQDSTIKYGGSEEYDNVKSLSQSSMTLHFENNSPFLVVTKMTRVIELSHWGVISVEETLDIRHTGAKFKGSFSRYDYQRLPNSGISAVKSFKTILPASSSDVYYRDEIGNISTSNLITNDDSVEVEIRPRFPLFGGWKTHYYIGYNLPSYTYLYKTGDLLALRMRFVDHVYDDMVIDDLAVKLILPESSKQISVSLPYEAERLEDTLHYTYLDTVGRPVITFKKKNVLEQHIQDFTLSYNFNPMMLIQEPLLIVSAFFILFFTVIIIVRLDFSITHDSVSEAKMRVQGVIEQVQAQHSKRIICYNSYETAIKDFKANKDSSAFANSRKSIDKSHKETTTTINGLMSKLREDGPDVHEKVSDVMRMDQKLMEKYNRSIQLAEQLVSKRLTKEKYVPEDQKNQHSIDEIREKLDSLCDNL
uniref:dolichyl-diphosphooligosaccharide--protein glycosyltransferase subunit 1-like isoform X2 n=1 Tax=Styela clava TaxID=7725 RepID=UPI00193A5EE7|nr:dolichyl-diphosphooligosaccharide--protein glycosyltransferase subunit 1-like isoform X2 [Styela clava]